MSEFTNEDIINAIGNMTVMELISLTKELEQKWGVKAEPQMSNTPSVVTDEKTVDQTEFTVVLVSVPADKKMATVKAVRELIGLGLLESKQLVEAAPKAIKESVSKEEAENIKAKLIEAGAVVEVK